MGSGSPRPGNRTALVIVGGLLHRTRTADRIGTPSPIRGIEHHPNMNLEIFLCCRSDVRTMAICPYCKRKIDKNSIEVEEIVKVKPFKMRNYMVVCPHCDSILGFGSNF